MKKGAISGHFRVAFVLKEATSVGCTCLLDGIRTPTDMREKYRKLSLQERIRAEEPDVFDRDVDPEKYRRWVLGF